MSESLFALEHPPTYGDEWETPIAFFRLQDARFAFTADACGTQANTRCARLLAGLGASWAEERVWCNPPYSDPAPWCLKAVQETQRGCPLAVLLLPVDTSTAWFHDLVNGVAQVDFVRGRLRFSGAGRARFASMLAIYRMRGSQRPPVSPTNTNATEVRFLTFRAAMA